MIICNLAVLLAERHLKITKVSQDTRISRTTLTALANNYGSGIQFETINTLCIYLKTNPEQLILFTPVNIDKINAKVESTGNKVLSVEVSMSIGIAGKERKCSMTGNIYLKSENNEISDIQIDLDLWDEEANPSDEDLREENMLFKKAFGMLSRPFIEYISDKVQGEIMLKIDNSHLYSIADGAGLSFNWPFDDWGIR